jgi:hypothetical protein
MTGIYIWYISDIRHSRSDSEPSYVTYIPVILVYLRLHFNISTGSRWPPRPPGRPLETRTAHAGDMPDSDSGSESALTGSSDSDSEVELQGLNHDGPGRGSHRDGHAARSLRVRGLAAVPVTRAADATMMCCHRGPRPDPAAGPSRRDCHGH